MRGVELVAHSVGAEHRGERGARLEKLYRGKRARIFENDAGAVIEIENEPREPRKLLRRG